MAQQPYIVISCRFSIALEDDSGKWLLIQHVSVDGRYIGSQPVHWFCRKEDAEEILRRIRGE